MDLKQRSRSSASEIVSRQHHLRSPANPRLLPTYKRWSKYAAPVNENGAYSGRRRTMLSTGDPDNTLGGPEFGAWERIQIHPPIATMTNGNGAIKSERFISRLVLRRAPSPCALRIAETPPPTPA